MILSLAGVAVLAFIQTTSFALVSRARNRDHMGYHAVASTLSNGIWFAMMGILVVSEFNWTLAIPYIFGTVCGSLFGAKVSMRIEQWLVASTDNHLKGYNNG